MSTKEKESNYREAVRYVENAAEILRGKAKKSNGFYQDKKYVRIACGTAYNAVLLALATYLETKGTPIERKKSSRVSVDGYRRRLAALDNKILDHFNNAYNTLHLDGYYDGINSYATIRSGIDSAVQIINKIKPIGLAGLKLN